MDLRKDRKRSLKVLEQQEAEIERIEAAKKRRCQRKAEAKIAQRQSMSVRRKEAEAKAAKRQAETEEEKERRRLQDLRCRAAKRQSAPVRQKEAEAMSAKRQAETEEEKESRRLQDLQSRAAKRQSASVRQKEAEAMSTKRQSASVRQKEAEAMAAKRQSPLVRQKEAKAMAAKRRAETEKERFDRRQNDALSKKRKRASRGLTEASHAFISATKDGPDFVCVSCTRLMYRKTVQEFHASSEFVVPESQNKQWICKTCHNALKRGTLPAQAKANSLELDNIPDELSDLNPLEVRLISLRIPFMKMVALPCGKQRAIHGPAVNVPTDLTPVCTLLPRLPSQAQMVPMKLKRKLCYKGHYMYQYIRPVKVLAALQWLKSNNPLYRDVEVNDDWLSDAAEDDAELWEALSAEHCPPPPSSPAVTITASSRDEVTLNTLAQERGFSVRDVPRDGNCLFSAVAVQLDSLGIQPGETSLREQLVEHLQAHPYTRDGSSHFREYVSAPVISDDPSNADTEAPSEQDEFINSIADPQLRQQLRWLRYIERLSAGAWGDHIAVQGLADMLHVDIHIISTINPDMELIRTSHQTPIGVIHLGLIGQFHYQALERMVASSQSANGQPESPTEEHDKEFIEDQEAFQLQAQLRGLPYDSFLQREDTVDATTDNVFTVDMITYLDLTLILAINLL